MKDCNYVVNREDIYVGILSGTIPKKIEVFPNGMYANLLKLNEEQIYTSFDDRRYLLDHKTHLCYENGCGWYMDGEFRRNMLFILDSDKLANDLLYDSPHYPVFNITEHEKCLTAPISFKNNVYQMKRLLEYFKYPEKLTYDNILQIKKQFFGDFILDNCELFGFYETNSDETGREMYDLFGNHRTFNNDIKENAVLPRCYFINLATLRCRTKDWFIPNELEGPIKSLKL